MPRTIAEDTREISGLFFDDAEGSQIRVGDGRTTKIEAYLEAGDGAFVPWFAVFNGDEIRSRVNAMKIGTVVYK